MQYRLPNTLSLSSYGRNIDIKYVSSKECSIDLDSDLVGINSISAVDSNPIIFKLNNFGDTRNLCVDTDALYCDKIVSGDVADYTLGKSNYWFNTSYIETNKARKFICTPETNIDGHYTFSLENDGISIRQKDYEENPSSSEYTGKGRALDLYIKYNTLTNPSTGTVGFSYISSNIISSYLNLNIETYGRDGNGSGYNIRINSTKDIDIKGDNITYIRNGEQSSVDANNSSIYKWCIRNIVSTVSQEGETSKSLFGLTHVRYPNHINEEYHVLYIYSDYNSSNETFTYTTNLKSNIHVFGDELTLTKLGGADIIKMQTTSDIDIYGAPCTNLEINGTLRTPSNAFGHCGLRFNANHVNLYHYRLLSSEEPISERLNGILCSDESLYLMGKTVIDNIDNIDSLINPSFVNNELISPNSNFLNGVFNLKNGSIFQLVIALQRQASSIPNFSDEIIFAGTTFSQLRTIITNALNTEQPPSVAGDNVYYGIALNTLRKTNTKDYPAYYIIKHSEDHPTHFKNFMDSLDAILLEPIIFKDIGQQFTNIYIKVNCMVKSDSSVSLIHYPTYPESDNNTVDIEPGPYEF